MIEDFMAKMTVDSKRNIEEYKEIVDGFHDWGNQIGELEDGDFSNEQISFNKLDQSSKQEILRRNFRD